MGSIIEPTNYAHCPPLRSGTPHLLQWRDVPPPGSLALAVALALVGPPKLPPLPGEQPPQPPAEEGPAKPTARPVTPNQPTARPVKPNQPSPQAPTSSPTTGPSPQAPTPSPTTGPSPQAPIPPARPTPTVPAAAKPKPLPGPLSGPSESFGPTVMEPPEPPAETEAGAEAPRRRSPGDAPAMGAGLLPGEDDDTGAPLLRFPPPSRPPYSGNGLFIGAGISFGASLAEQIVGHVLVKRRCIEPFAATQQLDPDDPTEVPAQAEDYGQALVGCIPGVLPAIALRLYSELGLLTTIGLAAGGAAVLAKRRAYEDVFADRNAPVMTGLRIGGAALVGVGVVTWLTTGALSWGLLASCRDAKCATRARLMAFTTRDAGAVMVAAGAGMLAYSLSHRRAYDRFLRERLLSVGTAYVPGGAGLSLSGRF